MILVPDGAPLPQWAGRPEEARSFSATRPVNVDHAVTVIRLAEKPFTVGAPVDTMPRAAQLDAVFMSSACARSSAITTEPDAAYRYGANIHNQGEGVICSAESRLLIARQLGLSVAAVAEIESANRVTPSLGGGRAPSLQLPAFDERRYERLPRFGAIFTLG